jgi:hypothetical protein
MMNCALQVVLCKQDCIILKAQYPHHNKHTLTIALKASSQGGQYLGVALCGLLLYFSPWFRLFGLSVIKSPPFSLFPREPGLTT